MGLIVIATLSIFLSILLLPSASLQTPPHSSNSATETVDILPHVWPWPRKFRLLEEARVRAHGFPVPKPNHKQKKKISGKNPHWRERNEIHAIASRGTGREWADVSSRFVTMDYSHVKRRRPVHNMSLQRP